MNFRRLRNFLFITRSLLWAVTLALAIGGAAAVASDYMGSTEVIPLDDPPFSYTRGVPSGSVAELQERLDRGQITLQHEPEHGYLLSLLAALKVSKASQMMVFSKTSFQRDLISPKTPRAIYFGDDVYVGFIPGAPLLEIAAADPKLGGVFYTLDQTQSKKPRLVRRNDCLECHATSKTMGVPGFVVRSLTTEADGSVEYNSGTGVVDHSIPLAERWGGWYVTGKFGGQAHLGNLIGTPAFERYRKRPGLSNNVASLHPYFNTARYPSAHSDIVALMVLDHQTHMHNFITRLRYEALLRIARYGEVKYLESQIDSFLQYLLFTEEAPLTAPLQGTTDFATQFAALGPKDTKGRSLRDFDLKTRLFKYPCSFLIYSPDFDSLPPALKAKIYQRLWDILTDKDHSPDFQHLTPESRRAILEILVDTKPDLPDYWKSKLP
ncbi:MAG: hypothetical protein JO316_11540 [Abitibacteriaceae bacterium]|nr:hypothetical protein [Abditibacteriaceae bacterium]